MGLIPNWWVVLSFTYVQQQMFARRKGQNHLEADWVRPWMGGWMLIFNILVDTWSMQPAAHRKLQRSPLFPGLPDQQITSRLIYHIWWSKSLTDSYKWVWHSLTPTSSPLDFCHPFLYYWSNLYLLILSIFIAPNFLVKSLILQMIFNSISRFDFELPG